MKRTSVTRSLLALAAISFALPASAFEVTVQTLSTQLTATARLTTTPQKQQDDMRTAMTAVWNQLDSTNVEPTGYPFGRILSSDANSISLEVGFPVGTKITAANGISPSSLPEGTVAMTDYTGPYEKIGTAHQAIQDWIKANGKTANGAPWEVYFSDPSDTAPDQLKFQIFYPIR